MDRKEKLYSKIIRNKISVIECMDDYYMIQCANGKNRITRCSDLVYKRHKYYLDSGRNKTNKLQTLMEKPFNSINEDNWEDLKEFINRLTDEDIDIANDGCDRLIGLLERPHVGYLDGNEIRVNSIKRLKKGEYSIKIQTRYDAYSKILKIPSGVSVMFKIHNKINWQIKIIDNGFCGIIHNANDVKEKQEFEVDLRVEVIEGQY